MPKNAALARHFVRAALDGVAPDLAATAELLTGELVTNVVIHARTEAEVRVAVAEGRVQVRVCDRRPERGLVPHDRHPYAATGRGLALVEELATSYGVHSADGVKTVWFELWPEPPAPPTSVWETVPPVGPTVSVALNDVPYALYWAAQQQWEGALRELMLATATATDGWAGVRPEDLAVAQDMSHMICACMTAAVEQETPDSSTLSLLVGFPAQAAPAAQALRRVLDDADALAQQGSLLTLPALPQIRAFRHWLLDQIAGQLTGAPAMAWTLVPGAPGATPTELAPWDASEVEASGVPTVAADDGNRIVAVNKPAASLLGWQPHELVGQRLTALIPGHLRKRHTAAFTSLLLTGEPRILGRSIPVPALHRDGRLIPVRLFIQTQEAVDGHTVFVAQLTTTTAPAAPAHDPRDELYTRSSPGPVHLPTTTKKAKRSGVEQADPEWLSLFADTGRAMTTTLDLDERVRRLCDVLTQRLADWCAADLVDEHGRVQRVCVAHRDPGVTISTEHLGRLPPVSDVTQGALSRVLRGAGPLLVSHIPPLSEARNDLDARQLELVDLLGGNSAVIAPLRADQEVFGALTMVRVQDEQPFAKEDILLIAELVRGISFGVDNARMHQRTHSHAEELQRALLPELPRVGDLELAARYVPSSTSAQVGGDWYDAFALPGGDTVLIIGDVSGHDLQAAVAMSTLRNMLRGLAVDRPEPPGDVLRRLDRASRTLSPGATATCLYALARTGAGGTVDLRYAAAGHLPPLLTTRDGDTRYLEAGRGLLIGLDAHHPRPSASDLLPPRSTLLLYTDGLIERRGESLDVGMARLRRHTAATAQAPLDVFCDELTIKFGADAADDIALLALRPDSGPHS
ncbi:SpoIIE family protein phosphatase [Streptomyces collinus]|uniref:SpoIIE family protein phosphatase n=1 Tax=Streptomyces collinus TaxID=42684 RepID=UPI0036395270